jgi:hypothetical protein
MHIWCQISNGKRPDPVRTASRRTFGMLQGNRYRLDRRHDAGRTRICTHRFRIEMPTTYNGQLGFAKKMTNDTSELSKNSNIRLLTFFPHPVPSRSGIPLKAKTVARKSPVRERRRNLSRHGPHPCHAGLKSRKGAVYGPGRCSEKDMPRVARVAPLSEDQIGNEPLLA